MATTVKGHVFNNTGLYSTWWEFYLFLLWKYHFTGTEQSLVRGSHSPKIPPKENLAKQITRVGGDSTPIINVGQKKYFCHIISAFLSLRSWQIYIPVQKLHFVYMQWFICFCLFINSALCLCISRIFGVSKQYYLKFAYRVEKSINVTMCTVLWFWLEMKNSAIFSLQ